MRATPHARKQFIATLLKQVPTATRAHALRLLRWGATYARLAEAQCNGDWPADNGTGGETCSECNTIWRGGFTGHSDGPVCPSCRAERIIRETCEEMGATAGEAVMGPDHLQRAPRLVTPHFQGDPRGHTIRLQIAGQPLDAYERAALAIPTS